jgi:hypothetical protein
MNTDNLQKLDDYTNRVLEILDREEMMPSWKLVFHDIAKDVSKQAFIEVKMEMEAASMVSEAAWDYFTRHATA